MKTEVGPKVTLPDELVEKILAMVPFPYIFKARVLSKSWLAKFSSISPQDDEEKKGFITTFQEQVRELCSTKWKTFCPVLLCKENIIAYDPASHQWRRMLSLSFLQHNLRIRSRTRWKLEGALLLITPYATMRNFLVVNILTRSWKQLPRPPRLATETDAEDMWLIHMSLQTYKVVVFRCDSRYRFVVAEVYDSRVGAWSRRIHYVVSGGVQYWMESNWGFLNGTFYMVIHTEGTGHSLLAFNLEEENFTLLQMTSLDDNFRCQLLACKSNLMSIMPNHRGDRVTIFKLDLGSRSCSKVTRGPPAALNFGRFLETPACDGNSLFFLGDKGFLAYNVDENEWSSFPLPLSVRPLPKPMVAPRVGQLRLAHPLLVDNWRPSSTTRGDYQLDYGIFQPGLNPFAAL